MNIDDVDAAATVHHPAPREPWSLVNDTPKVQYATADDGAHIAYQVVGDGPRDLVFILAGSRTWT